MFIKLLNTCFICGSAWLGSAKAAPLVPTSNFTQMPEAEWRSDRGALHLEPFTIGGVTLKYNRTNAPVVFATPPIPDIDNPNLGIGIGFYHNPTSPAPRLPVIIDFDVPISGFGATFLHVPDPRVLSGDLRPPARIEVYSMPAAQGALLGSVDSSGFYGPTWSRVVDFVGLYGYERVIRSAKLYGLGEDEYFAVEGYAVTLLEDTTPPEITEAFASLPTLWPPNNEMCRVEFNILATDASGIDYCRIISVSANELTSTDDWAITGHLSLLLRAKRSGNDADRTYFILIECSDAAGNKSWTTVTVIVPHDQRIRPNPPSPISTLSPKR